LIHAKAKAQKKRENTVDGIEIEATGRREQQFDSHSHDFEGNYIDLRPPNRDSTTCTWPRTGLS
jgi:hypothetical protein